jgi:hypothetical protein
VGKRHEEKRELYREDKVHEEEEKEEEEEEEEEEEGGQERKECYGIYLSLNTQLQCDSQCKSPRRKVHMSLQSGTKSCITPVTIATWLDSP